MKPDKAERDRIREEWRAAEKAAVAAPAEALPPPEPMVIVNARGEARQARHADPEALPRVRLTPEERATRKAAREAKAREQRSAVGPLQLTDADHDSNYADKRHSRLMAALVEARWTRPQ